MCVRLTASMALLVAVAVAQTPTRTNCIQNPGQCEIEIGGQVLKFGMPKDRALVLLAKTPYHLNEDHKWPVEMADPMSSRNRRTGSSAR